MIIVLFTMMQESGEATGAIANKNLPYYLLAAIGVLAGVIGVLYKQKEAQRDKIEKNQSEHARDLREILEKTLVAFTTVEVAVKDITHTNKEEVIKKIQESTEKVQNTIKDAMNK